MEEKGYDSIVKQYPEFLNGCSVRYLIADKIVDWEVLTSDEEVIMIGKFSSKDFFSSKFTLIPSNIDENTYESLFYLYFEVIKLTCIDLVEDADVEDIEEIN